MPTHDSGDGLLQDRHVDGARQTGDERDVVERAVGLQPMQEPQSLLRGRKRQRTVAWQPRDLRCAGILDRMRQRPYRASEATNGRMLKQQRKRQVQPQRRSEQHTSELQSLLRTSAAVFYLHKNTSTPKT